MASADPAGDHGTSGLFTPESWHLHLPGDDPRTAQYASAHESHHYQLQNATVFGALIRVLFALHKATGENRYRTTVAQLTTVCRHVQEAFATWAPAAALGWSRDELAAAYPAYAWHFDAMDQLVAPVTSPYLRLHAAHALSRACMQPPILDSILAAGLGKLTLADLRQRQFPDTRFAMLRRRGIDWRDAVQAASGQLTRAPGGAELVSAARLGAELFELRHDELWQAANEIFYNAVAGQLARYGAATIGHEAHLAATPTLLAAAAALTTQPLGLDPGGPRDPTKAAALVLRNTEAEEFTTGRPLRARLIPAAASAASMTADVADPHLFLVIRPRRVLLANYALNVTAARLEGTAAMLRRTVIDDDGATTVELLDITGGNPSSIQATGIPVITSIAMSALGSDAASRWGTLLGPGTATVLADVSLAAHLDVWLASPGASFRYALIRTESFGRVVPYLVGQVRLQGAGTSRLLLRPLSHAAVRIHKAAFAEIDPDGHKLAEDPAILDGHRRLLSLTLAHISGEEIRFNWVASS